MHRVVVKDVGGSFDPLGFAFLRFAVAALAFSPFMKVRRCVAVAVVVAALRTAPKARPPMRLGSAAAACLFGRRRGSQAGLLLPLLGAWRAGRPCRPPTGPPHCPGSACGRLPPRTVGSCRRAWSWACGQRQVGWACCTAGWGMLCRVRACGARCICSGPLVHPAVRQPQRRGMPPPAPSRRCCPPALPTYPPPPAAAAAGAHAAPLPPPPSSSPTPPTPLSPTAAGYITQSLGLLTTDASRASFLSTFTVLVVPLLAGMSGKGVSPVTWASCLAALVGVGLLEQSGAAPGIGDAWSMLSAVAFGIQMFRTEHWARVLGNGANLPLMSVGEWPGEGGGGGGARVVGAAAGNEGTAGRGAGRHCRAGLSEPRPPAPLPCLHGAAS